MKLRTKFAIALLSVMLVLSGVVLGSVELFKQQTVADERQSINETADLTARQIEATVETRREEVRLFAARDVRDPNATGEYLPEFVNRTQFFAAQTVSANGTVVDFRGGLPRAQREAAIGTRVSNRSHVRAALDGDVAVSEPERVPGTDVTILKIAAPIFTDSPSDIEAASNPDAALVGAIYIDFSNFFTTARTVRTSDQSVAVYDTVDGDRLTLLAPEQSFERNLTATQTFGLRGWEWTIELTRDRSALDRRLDNLVFVQGLSLTLVLGSLVALGVWEYRTNLRQAERLLDGFVAIQRGDYDYSLTLTAADEWERIGEGYADLARGLAARESALREREQRLEVLNRVLRHNVRNEMSVVHNYADIVREFTEDDQIESAAGTILTAGSRLIDLSDTASQIRSAFEDADRRHAFDADSLVVGVVEEVGTAYPDAAIDHSVPDDVTVVGLPALDVALANVVENACEHSDAAAPGVQVTVTFDPTGDPERDPPPTLEMDGTADEPPVDPLDAEPGSAAETTGLAHVAVADDGPGIPDHEYEVLTAGEETALEHGSGLGLWLVFWVVTKSGGDLSFDDREPRGSVVTLTLPAVGAEEGPLGGQTGDSGR